VENARLLTISTFSRAVGIPASALRHYASEGILEPADVDSFSGYRYYAPEQIVTGVVVRDLRTADVPLTLMREILAADNARAVELLDEHREHQATSNRERDRALRGAQVSLAGGHTPARARVSGPVLAHALDQVLAASRHAADEVDGMVWTVSAGEVTLMATDRYWLAQRRIPASDAVTGARMVTSSAGGRRGVHGQFGPAVGRRWSGTRGLSCRSARYSRPGALGDLPASGAGTHRPAS
jgi:DNA-binding transcriptional MerR regulator